MKIFRIWKCCSSCRLGIGDWMDREWCFWLQSIFPWRLCPLTDCTGRIPWLATLIVKSALELNLRSLIVWGMWHTLFPWLEHVVAISMYHISFCSRMSFVKVHRWCEKVFEFFWHELTVGLVWLQICSCQIRTYSRRKFWGGIHAYGIIILAKFSGSSLALENIQQVSPCLDPMSYAFMLANLHSAMMFSMHTLQRVHCLVKNEFEFIRAI